MENYRVENKESVHYNGKKTSFKLFERRGRAFVFSGVYFAPGWNLSDADCIAHAVREDAENYYGEDD
jgi:hypothetical protein